MIEPVTFKTALSHTLGESVKRFWNDMSPELRNDYGDAYLHKIVNRITMDFNSASPDTYKVVDAIMDALTSQRPQTRYVIGLKAKWMVFISYLPTAIGDWLLSAKS
ncbi:hypothetical protein OS493_002335 [Desmophyllum pertusum]|uniref:Uncharacterized protein n=1 Tax=Desmophyllum pertusum TaxID=174260 RepID=A0A9W9YSV3_9CNID|nr:hypothetical protein OS493_002335 [Desmophyllum pertusum]